MHAYSPLETRSQFTAHDTALAMSIERTKLVRMWNRRESRNDVGVYQFTTLKIALEQA